MKEHVFTNSKLIFQLSLFGLAMGIATVYFIPPSVEPFIWLVIFIFCAIIIAKQCHKRFFLHGFLVSMLNSIWITVIHILLFDEYITRHPGELEMMEKFPLPYSLRVSMIMMGPVIGAMSGLVLGLFSYIAARIIKNKDQTA